MVISRRIFAENWKEMYINKNEAREGSAELLFLFIKYGKICGVAIFNSPLFETTGAIGTIRRIIRKPGNTKHGTSLLNMQICDAFIAVVVVVFLGSLRGYHDYCNKSVTWNRTPQ